jgi:hypothetical protein
LEISSLLAPRPADWAPDGQAFCQSVDQRVARNRKSFDRRLLPGLPRRPLTGDISPKKQDLLKNTNRQRLVNGEPWKGAGRTRGPEAAAIARPICVSMEHLNVICVTPCSGIAIDHSRHWKSRRAWRRECARKHGIFRFEGFDPAGESAEVTTSFLAECSPTMSAS